MTDDRDVESALTANRARSWTTGGIGDAAFAAMADGLAASELWSLLLEVFARRADRRSPASLLQQWERDGFTRPAPIDQRTFVELDGHLLAAADAHGFASIELSPLAPLGACSVVGLGSQHRIVSALRGTEVVADPTNLLALECARRLRAGTTSVTPPQPVVRLATCHRCVRAQKVPDIPHFAQHFRIFCLASAAHEQKDQRFVTSALIEQIETHLAALDRLEAHGYAFADRRVKVLATDARAPLGDRIAEALRQQRPEVPVTREALEHAYYDGLRFMISTRAPNGQDYPLIDGGAFNWLGRLTSNQKLVFAASGMGAQLAAGAFQTSRG